MLDDDDVIFTTHESSQKAKALRRDPCVACCVDDDQPPFSYVMMAGTATVSTDLDELRRWATRIGGRYMGSDRATEFGRRNGVPGEQLVRVAPTKIIAARDVAN